MVFLNWLFAFFRNYEDVNAKEDVALILCYFHDCLDYTFTKKWGR
jgi:hypothetical protein